MEFDTSNFAEECYETYSNYCERYGNNKVSLTDFMFEIISNKDDMKEYLSSNEEQLGTYLENFYDITEAFPFSQYKKAADSIGVTLEYNGDGEISYQKYSPAGQDFSLIFDCEPDMSDFIESLNEQIENFDISENTMLCVDKSGHGKNGAPYGLEDVLEDMKACKSNAKSFSSEIAEKIEKHNESLDKSDQEIVNGIFETVLRKTEESEKYYGGTSSFTAILSRAQNSYLEFENGNIHRIKDVLTDFYNQIGVTDQKQLEEKVKEKVDEYYKNKPVKTVFTDRLLSPTESNLCRMFDDIFNSENVKPEKYMDFIVSAHYPQNNNLSDTQWWKKAIDHAVNSGGAMWMGTYDRMKVLEKYELIPKGTCDRKEDAPIFNADKLYGEHLYTYLHLKGLTKPELKEAAVKKDKEFAEHMKKKGKDLPACGR